MYITDKYKDVIAEGEILAETSKHQGIIGNKIDVDIVDVKRRQMEGMYGMNTFFRFLDASGNVYIWSTTSYIPEDEEINHICGTVKCHNTYHNIKQTCLRRVKIS